MRTKQVRTGTDRGTTWYLDKLYEEDSDGTKRLFIGSAAVLSFPTNEAPALHFTLKDRLGSATTIADDQGNVISERYFDPFGRTAASHEDHALDITNRDTDLSRFQDLAATNNNRRGFTEHEHLNAHSLIHMNGRVYDYNSGRFLSVDPYITFPSETQSINPYSYIMNNPMAGTDPTGYAFHLVLALGAGAGAAGATFVIQAITGEFNGADIATAGAAAAISVGTFGLGTSFVAVLGSATITGGVNVASEAIQQGVEGELISLEDANDSFNEGVVSSLISSSGVKVLAKLLKGKTPAPSPPSNPLMPTARQAAEAGATGAAVGTSLEATPQILEGGVEGVEQMAQDVVDAAVEAEQTVMQRVEDSIDRTIDRN